MTHGLLLCSGRGGRSETAKDYRAMIPDSITFASWAMERGVLQDQALGEITEASAPLQDIDRRVQVNSSAGCSGGVYFYNDHMEARPKESPKDRGMAFISGTPGEQWGRAEFVVNMRKPVHLMWGTGERPAFISSMFQLYMDLLSAGVTASFSAYEDQPTASWPATSRRSGICGRCCAIGGGWERRRSGCRNMRGCTNGSANLHQSWNRRDPWRYRRNAISNLRHYITDTGIAHLNWVRIPGHDYGDGRIAFIVWRDTRCHELQMPGCTLSKVRCQKGDNGWGFYRLYIDGSSWLWDIGMLREEDFNETEEG